MSPITMAAFMSGACAPWTADPAVKIPANCLLRGFPGTYTRFSAETHWRRSIIDSYGQVFTPFASLRADVATLSVVNDPGVANFLPVGDSSLARVMPTVGIEYRYPFIGVQSWGTHLIEPIAQVIVRPNETNIGRFPNEDAQSLVFDDTNLFKVDKFSGWDRMEGGGRANVGVQYTAQFHRAGQFNVLFGQSYHLFGTNSFAVRDLTNTGLDSGLDSRRSDYVARVAYRPNAMLGITSRFRFDRDSFDVRRFELETTASVSRWTVSLAYGRYDPQPALGFLTEREGFRGSARLKLTENWNLFGSLLYDIDQKKPVYASVGVGYVDDCLIVALNYMHTYLHTTGQHDNQTVLLQVQFRTIGGIGTSHVIARPDGA
jgi:LPS-assembly protein